TRPTCSEQARRRVPSGHHAKRGRRWSLRKATGTRFGPGYSVSCALSLLVRATGALSNQCAVQGRAMRTFGPARISIVRASSIASIGGIGIAALLAQLALTPATAQTS